MPIRIIHFLFIVHVFYISTLKSQSEFITKWANFSEAKNAISFKTKTDSGSVEYTWSTQPSNKSGKGYFTKTTEGVITLSNLKIEIGDTLTLALKPEKLKRFAMTNIKSHLIDISQWGDVVWESMRDAFAQCINLQISAQDIPNLSNVTETKSMFEDCWVLNSPSNIGSWDVSHVVDFTFMFHCAYKFNQNISNWDVSSAEIMYDMFSGAFNFNQDVSNWNTSKVIDMSYMFSYTDSFDQDLGKWDIKSARNMTGMFMSAKKFNRVLYDWSRKFSKIVDLDDFFSYSGLSVEKYDSNLIVFYNSDLYSLSLGAHNLKYCNALTERIKLTESVFSGGKGWWISSDMPFSKNAALSPKNTSLYLLNNCDNYYINPFNNNQHLLHINRNGNLNFKPQKIVVNHNHFDSLPEGVTSKNGYYEKSNGNDTTIRISNRLLSIITSGWFDENGGVIVRVYYDSTEQQNMVKDATPNNGGTIIESAWFKSNLHSASDVVADINTSSQAMPNAVKIIPINTGKENGIHYADFLMNEFGSIGFYAKTNTLPLKINTLNQTPLIDIFPNPNNGVIYLRSKSSFNLEIKNSLGQVISTLNHSINDNSTISIELPKGIYFFYFLVNGNLNVQKVVFG
jgi:surface protein